MPQLVPLLLAPLLAFANVNLGHQVPIDPARFKQVDDVFVSRHFSQDWDTGGWLAEQKAGVHPAAFVANRTLQAFGNAGPFAFLPPVDPKRSAVWIRTMNFGDPIITALVLDLKKRGVGQIKLIATGSAGFSVRAGRAAKFRHADLTPDQGWMGDEAKTLIKNGFVINPAEEKPFEILVTAVKPGATIEDLMHEKATTIELRFRKEGILSGLRKSFGFDRPSPLAPLLVEEDGEKVLRTTLFLTDNFTPRKQDPNTEISHVFDHESLPLKAQPSSPMDMVLNRVFELSLPELVTADHAHARALAQALRQDGRLDEIPDPNPERTTYTFADGSFVQLMYTNHTRNPFDREIELHRAALAGDFKVREIVRSHFQDVNGSVLESLRELLDHDPDISAEFYYADDAISPRRGNAAAYVGIPVRSDLGLHAGFSATTVGDRLRAWVYRRGEGDEDIAKPGKVLNHDKTTVYVGDQWTYVFTGSWNLSAHVENAEWQMLIKTKTDSELARYFLGTIRSQKKRHPELFEPLMEVVVLKGITDYLGIDSDTVTPQNIRDIEADLARNDFHLVIKRMRALRETGRPKVRDRRRDSRNDLHVRQMSVDEKEFETRISILENAFGAWRQAINGIRGQVTTAQDDWLATALNYAWVGVQRLGSGALDQLAPAFFGRGLFTDTQLIALLNGLNIERTRMHQLTKREAGVTNTSGFSRLRMLYSTTGGRREMPRDFAEANALLLYNVVRQSMGLPLESKEDFNANLATEARRSPVAKWVCAGEL